MAPFDIQPDLVALRYPLPHLAQQLRKSRKVRIVAIGSSSTAGEGGILPYPARLQTVLRTQFPSTVIDVLNRELGGQDAPEELARFESDVIAENPALVIWQVGTNAIFHDYQLEEVASAIEVGLQLLNGLPTDVLLMDPQYAPALLLPEKANATHKMVSLIATAGEKAGVNVFSRFALMKHLNEKDNIPLSDMIDPNDPDRLHQSELATAIVTEGIRLAIAKAVGGLGGEIIASDTRPLTSLTSGRGIKIDKIDKVGGDIVGGDRISPRHSASEDPPGPGVDDSAARRVNLLFATTRCVSKDPAEIFSGEREEVATNYGKANVRVPEVRALGTVTLPFELRIFSISLYKQTLDPKKHFVIQGCEAVTKGDWLETVRRSPSTEALIFVHGFNVPFVDGLYRCAQIAWDIRYPGIPILFSWASMGKLGLRPYVYDLDSASNARRRFVELLQDLQRAGMARIHVLAHSMGNQVVLDGLASFARQELALGKILMAAPDVDRNHYLEYVPMVLPMTDGMTLYASSRDKAMIASRKLAGDIHRAGDVPQGRPIVIERVDTIDASEVGKEIFGLNHGIFAAKKSILNDIKLLLSSNLAPPRLAEISGMPAGVKPAKWWRYLP